MREFEQMVQYRENIVPMCSCKIVFIDNAYFNTVIEIRVIKVLHKRVSFLG